jgi:hypothetical protein
VNPLDHAGQLLEIQLDGLEQRTASPWRSVLLGVAMGLAITIGGIAVFLLVLLFLVEVFA